MQRVLYWVNRDLRVEDNIALQLAQESTQLICVYIIDKQWFESNQYQSKPLGEKRWQFLQACLHDMSNRLLTLGQRLYVVYGDTLTSLTTLCAQYQITDLITSKLPGSDENKTLTSLCERYPDITLKHIDQFTLFSELNLPFDIQALPGSYSKFRKQVASTPIHAPLPAVTSLPQMFDCAPELRLYDVEPSSTLTNTLFSQGHCFQGGETAARQHLDDYFSSSSPSTYKDVRNHLDGWENSSKFSPWINYGCLSVRQIMQKIKHYEQTVERNESTEALYLELLWRDYFQWLHFKEGSKFYQFKGLMSHPPLTSFYPERFKKWCLGNTPYPLVNACMNELRHSGYLSNRGRQIVASCLVNELSVDWRYGAAWFEEQLIDYDAAVNWGNWQYIAGVGVDPRGGRHFNITKQTNTYDLKGEYQRKWIAESLDDIHTLDSVDASDWPIASTASTAKGNQSRHRNKN